MEKKNEFLESVKNIMTSALSHALGIFLAEVGKGMIDLAYKDAHNLFVANPVNPFSPTNPANPFSPTNPDAPIIRPYTVTYDTGTDNIATKESVHTNIESSKNNTK